MKLAENRYVVLLGIALVTIRLSRLLVVCMKDSELLNCSLSTNETVRTMTQTGNGESSPSK